MTKAKEKVKKEKRESLDTIWVKRGVDSVYFQRESQVAWWTILGGIAVAALLTEAENVFAAAMNQRWQLILFFSASALLIVNAWVQMAWTSLILKLPISMPTTLLYFVQGFLLSLISLQVTNPPIWAALGTILIIWVILTQLYFKRIGAWVGFPESIKTRVMFGVRVYSLFIIMGIGGFINLYWYPSREAETVWGIIALLNSIAALVMQHFGMKAEKQALGIP